MAGRSYSGTPNYTETRYLWCGERICQARNGSDTPIRRYYDEGEQTISGSTTSYYYAQDHLGSVRDLVTASGTVLASYDYDPYGNPTRSTIQTSGTRADYRYAGLFYHAPSGLYLTHYRVYDPVTARWLSRDPIGEEGGINLYGYVGGNPISQVDPLGLSDLAFDRGSGTLTVYTSQGQQVGQFPAANNTTSNSNGPWPNGTYGFSHYVPHPESGPTGPYGSNGNYVFDVPGRSGMGVHSGRSGPQSKTQGCIRTTDDATDFLRELHSRDPLRTITVKGWSPSGDSCECR